MEERYVKNSFVRGMNSCTLVESCFLDMVHRITGELVGSAGFREVKELNSVYVYEHVKLNNNELILFSQHSSGSSAKTAEFGIVVKKKWQNLGLCTDALYTNVQFAKEKLEVSQITACTLEDNNIMRQFLSQWGFEHAGEKVDDEPNSGPKWHEYKGDVDTILHKMTERKKQSGPFVKVQAVIGDYRHFMSTLTDRLSQDGLDVARYEMDHICYRCSSWEEYTQICSTMVPEYGKLLSQCIIGTRPICTIQFHSPVTHGKHSVTCLEVPAPKQGSEYESGLEHAEFVVGTNSDSVLGNKVLVSFMEFCEKAGIQLKLNSKSMNKSINADVSVKYDSSIGTISAKFHARPLYEVVAYEQEHQLETLPSAEQRLDL